MIEQVKDYLNQIETAASQTEKTRATDELHAFYETLSDEEYQLVKEKLLTPRLNELKVRMAELDDLIDEVFLAKYVR